MKLDGGKIVLFHLCSLENWECKRRLQVQATKGVRWMPWYLAAMKDVVSCDKRRRGANNP